jgi:hypothetical protein
MAAMPLASNFEATPATILFAQKNLPWGTSWCRTWIVEPLEASANTPQAAKPPLAFAPPGEKKQKINRLKICRGMVSNKFE